MAVNKDYFSIPWFTNDIIVLDDSPKSWKINNQPLIFEQIFQDIEFSAFKDYISISFYENNSALIWKMQEIDIKENKAKEL